MYSVNHHTHLVFERKRLRHVPGKSINDYPAGVRQLHDLLLDLGDGCLLLENNVCKDIARIVW